MPDSAQAKIIDAAAAKLVAYAPLDGQTVITDRSPEEAVTAGEVPAIVIACEAWDFRDGFEQGMTEHSMLINFDVIESSQHVGMVNRANQSTIAHIIAALGEDTTLGGLLEILSPLNVAPPMDNGKSIGGASLQCLVKFYTPSWDHFTIVGQGGVTF